MTPQAINKMSLSSVSLTLIGRELEGTVFCDDFISYNRRVGVDQSEGLSGGLENSTVPEIYACIRNAVSHCAAHS
jgi:hypothetical protein